MHTVIIPVPISPLVWKLDSSLSRYGKTVYPSVESGWGTADHLTGSLLTNWCVLETMVCSDFFSDVSFLSYKFLVWIWRHGLCLHNVAVWIRDLCNVLRLEKLFHDWDWCSLTWFAWMRVFLIVWCMYILSITALTMLGHIFWIHAVHDPWLGHCTSPWLCMNC